MRRIKILLIVILISLVAMNVLAVTSYATNDNTIENNTISNNVVEDNTVSNNAIENNIVNDVDESNNEINNTLNQIEEQNVVEEKPVISYNTHVQDIGWQAWKNEGELAGTTGLSKRLEGIHIAINNNVNCNIRYKVHVQDIGWQGWKSNGEMAGTTGWSRRLEAIQIELENSDKYSITYRVHVQDIGWQAWKYDGELAGTTGLSKRLEAIEIKIVEKQIKGTSWIDTPIASDVIYNKQDIFVRGWRLANIKGSYIKAYINDKEVEMKNYQPEYRQDVLNVIHGFGTANETPIPGFTFLINTEEYLKNEIYSLKIIVFSPDGAYITESRVAFRIDNSDMHITTNAHVQNVGWQGNRFENTVAGTTGCALRMEAVMFNLYNVPEGAKVKYRAHVQDFGWQNWKSNEEIAGTVGASKRVEALQIILENMDDYSVEYNAHVEGIGWQGWKTNGETAGTIGESKRIEAIKVRIVKKYKYSAIDVSEFNGGINWSHVKQAGISHAFVRAGYRGYGISSTGEDGKKVVDSNFNNNMRWATEAGVNLGVYFVTQAKNEAEAIDEANFTLDLVKNYTIKMPIAIDVEWSGKEGNQGRGDLISTEQRTANIRAFCNRVKEAGYTPIIYLNVDFANNHVNIGELSEFDVWLANYTTNEKPYYDGAFTIWQYTSAETLYGINGLVDRNRCFKEY